MTRGSVSRGKGFGWWAGFAVGIVVLHIGGIIVGFAIGLDPYVTGALFPACGVLAATYREARR